MSYKKIKTYMVSKEHKNMKMSNKNLERKIYYFQLKYIYLIKLMEIRHCRRKKISELEDVTIEAFKNISQKFNGLTYV